MTTDPTTSDEPVTASFAEAVRLFNEREFFTCHDVLEELWGETIGHDRDFLQGLLHVAVSLHHLSEGNPAGARKMYASSLRYLKPYGSDYQTIDLDRLRSDLAACFAPIRDGVTPGFQAHNIESFPLLHGSSDHE